MHVAVELQRIAPERREDDPADDQGENYRQTGRCSASRRAPSTLTGLFEAVSVVQGPGDHQMTDASLGVLVVLDDTDQPAAVHHADPVRQLEQLFELGRDQDRRDTGVGSIADALAGAADIRDIEAVGRLVVHHEPWFDRELAAEKHLLYVAAGENWRSASSGPGARTS